MFTGIVEELGTVLSREGGRFRFSGAAVLDDVTEGASIAVNGVCLTVVDWDVAGGWWEAVAVAALEPPQLLHDAREHLRAPLLGPTILAPAPGRQDGGTQEGSA